MGEDLQFKFITGPFKTDASPPWSIGKQAAVMAVEVEGGAGTTFAVEVNGGHVLNVSIPQGKPGGVVAGEPLFLLEPGDRVALRLVDGPDVVGFVARLKMVRNTP